MSRRAFPGNAVGFVVTRDAAVTGVARVSPAMGVDAFEVVETLLYASSCHGAGGGGNQRTIPGDSRSVAEVRHR